MSTLCPLCNPKVGRRTPGQGRSRVVETRRKNCRVTFQGTSRRNTTVTRVRECLKCRFRWKTMEVMVFSRRPNSTSWGGKRGRKQPASD